MPKIIENLREELLAEAKKQIAERGYKNTTIRSVAAECGIAVGTVYNYFKSKDMLIASFILVDWLECVRSIAAQPKDAKMTVDSDAMKALRKTYIENNTYDLIDPLNVTKLIEDLSNEVDNFNIEVDAALSVSNAVTVIEIEY